MNATLLPWVIGIIIGFFIGLVVGEIAGYATGVFCERKAKADEKDGTQ